MTVVADAEQHDVGGRRSPAQFEDVAQLLLVAARRRFRGLPVIGHRQEACPDVVDEGIACHSPVVVAVVRWNPSLVADPDDDFGPRNIPAAQLAVGTGRSAATGDSEVGRSGPGAEKLGNEVGGVDCKGRGVS